jgi:RNA ligase (TIGR02306 family)
MENNNSVCYVAKINEVKPIEGADNIELVVAGGWNAITKKGEYKVEDLVVIATTDAVIPRELSHRMEVANYLRKGGRVRTVKLRGVYSECLIIPIIYARAKSIVEGKDLMEELKITKYEPPVKQIQLASGRKIKYKDNPNFHVYYKFPNLKNVQGMFNEEDEVEITRKIHGTNARYGIVKKTKLTFKDKILKFFRLADEWINYDYVYGSHNVEKGSDSQGFYSEDVWGTAAEKYGIKEKLWAYAKDRGYNYIGDGIIIYGEIYGPGIQKGYDYGLKEIEFKVFDIKLNNEYMDTTNTRIALNYFLNLSYVEVLYNSNWNQKVQDKFTFNSFIEGTKIPHEGIVIKHTTGERQKVAKVINPDYHIYAEKYNVGDSH